MPFVLPFDPPVVAMIDVRRGGEIAAEAVIEVMSAGSHAAPAGAAVYLGIDDDKVLTYAQWVNANQAQSWLAQHHDAVARSGPGGRWSARLFELASSANRGPIDLTADAAQIAHTGLFAMHAANSLAAFLPLAKEAAEIAVAHSPTLLSANFHASLDRERAVNLGFWSDVEGFRSLAANPPFVNRYWEGLADNEAGLYRRVWVAG